MTGQDTDRIIDLSTHLIRLGVNLLGLLLVTTLACFGVDIPAELLRRRRLVAIPEPPFVAISRSADLLRFLDPDRVCLVDFMSPSIEFVLEVLQQYSLDVWHSMYISSNFFVICNDVARREASMISISSLM